MASIVFLALGFVVYNFLSKKKVVYTMLILLSAVFMFCSCNAPKSKNEETKTKENSDLVSIDSSKFNPVDIPELDKNASLIAGMDTSSISSPVTIAYIRNLNRIWYSKNNRFVLPIRN